MAISGVAGYRSQQPLQTGSLTQPKHAQNTLFFISVGSNCNEVRGRSNMNQSEQRPAGRAAANVNTALSQLHQVMCYSQKTACKHARCTAPESIGQLLSVSPIFSNLIRCALIIISINNSNNSMCEIRCITGYK